METQTDSDKIIEELGGCGRFQIRMNIVCHVMKALSCFSIMSMVLMSKTPPWWCSDDVILYNMTSCTETQNGSELIACPKKTCLVNGTMCSMYEFGGSMHTYVSEFGLVCDLDYIPSTIMSIQVGGMLAGNIIAGHLAEFVGRKIPFFLSILLLSIFNLAGYLSVNWVMFAAARLFIGVAFGFFMSTLYSLLSEFSLTSWRNWVIGFPSWSIEGCILALIGWLIQDWRYLQLFIALFGIPLLFAWFIIPESFRWYIAHDKPEKAKQILKRVADYNKKDLHDVEHMIKIPAQSRDTKHSSVELFKTRRLAYISLLLGYTWFALGLCYYGINFGIQALPGNVYLILFVFFAADIPTKTVGAWLLNKIGRRLTGVLCFCIIGAYGLAVGIVQSFDVPGRDTLTNIFALVAHTGASCVWAPVQTMTIELYPTVIRPIGFGTLSVCGRIGAMIGPQLAYLNGHVPGIMYYTIGGLSFFSILACFGLPETRDAKLDDKIEQTRNENNCTNTTTI